MLIQLIKADAGSRYLYGRIDETPDRAGDVFDYDSSKPHFEKWSAEQSEASGGRSLGNLRSMHGRICSGVLVSLACDDAAKAIDFCAHVVDDNEWAKVEAGAYTGFSPGGVVAKRWPDPTNPALSRYTAMPKEMSLVDRPCIPTATFKLLKADGIAEEMPFLPLEEIRPEEAQELAKMLGDVASRSDLASLVTALPASAVGCLFGQDGERAPPDAPEMLAKRAYSALGRKKAAASGAALADGSFPVEDKADVKRAAEAIGRAKDPDAARYHIIQRAKTLNATDELPADWEGSTRAEKLDAADDLAKGLGDVAQFSALLEGLSWLARSMACETAEEGDASPLAGRVAAWIRNGFDLLKDHLTEESGEVAARLQAEIDAIPLEAVAEKMDAAPDRDFPGGLPELAKMAGFLAAARENETLLRGENELLKAELAKLPRPGGPRLRVIEKGFDRPSDGTPDAEAAELAKIDAMPGDTAEQQFEKAMMRTRVALRHPRLIG